MPCDTIRETTVEISAADVALLSHALEAEGCTSVRVSGDTVTFVDREGNAGRYTKGQGMRVPQGSQFARDQNALKRAYSREVVKATTKRLGWKATWTGENVAVAVKRRF